MKKLKYISLGVAAMVAASCTKTQFDEFETTSGSANFSNYVAVGNSLTQGFQDNGVHNERNQQDNSYPAILAKQMQLANSSAVFKQPTVSGNGSGYLHLEWIDEEIELVDVAAAGSWGASGDASWDINTRYNNLGVSGIRLTDCVPTTGDPFSETINQFINSSNPMGGFLDWGTPFSAVSYLDHIESSNATFFTCWLGNNDVLGWATSGGDAGAFSIPPFGTIELTGMTDVQVFSEKYDAVLTAFDNMGAKGVCATIPDVTSIPFFTTVTLDAVGDDVWIEEGPESNNPGNVRLATNDDLLTLYASSDLGDGIGFTQANPIPHEDVLDRDEVVLSQSHTIALNNEIKAMAAKHGFPVADMHAYMKELESGITLNGVDYDAKFIEGGAFSLDGIHPNTRGYALVANKFIEVINQAYGSNIPQVVVANYPGIFFPN